MWRLTYSKQKHIITSQGPTRASLSEPERVRPLLEQKLLFLIVFLGSHCEIPSVLWCPVLF